ncbi:hypothetical protein Dsin_024965 [Dipteronia sinensis]|uniref:DUF4283 domain-containing protein n=1 Tax=Dipteronia sinensis TaxID=43782 RepID=A0AAD9ZUQ4_9ROSI|nr:hypothetical protein Dsin_024965 [Dipteronia sinensis]
MVSPLLHGLTEDPMSLGAALSSSPQTSSTTASICGEGTVSSNSRGCSLGIVLPTTSSLGDNLVTVGDSTIGSKSYTDLLKAPHASVQSFPMTSPPSKKGGFVSFGLMRLLINPDLSYAKMLLSDVWFLLVPWVPDFNPSLQNSTNANVWVRFYDLSWEYWHPKIIFYLARGIGVPLRLDKATIDGDFWHYVRVVVDVDMSALLPSSFLLERDEFHSSFISVKCENLPSFCSICFSVEHLPGSCHWNKSKVPTASMEKSSPPMAEVSVEETAFQPIPSRSSKMVYRPIDMTVQEISVFNAIAAIYQDLGPIDLVVVHQLATLGHSFIPSSESCLINSSDDSHSGPSSTVVGWISIPLSGSPYVQRVCNVLPRVRVSIASYGPTIQNDRRIVRDEINPSRDMRSESSLSNSQAELHFIADSSWAKQVEADDLDSDGRFWSSLGLHLVGMNDIGGLIPSIWVFSCDAISDPQIVLYDKQHLTISISIKSLMHWYTFVYASKSASIHRVLWHSLREMAGSFSSSWLVVGDFNPVLGAHECLGSRSPARGSCEHFKSMIEDCNLIGVQSQGARFTWVRGRSSHTRVERRLDRTLVSEGCATCWRDISCVALPHQFSDHCPLWIRLVEPQVSISRPFRFQSMWMDHPDFMNLVRMVWIIPCDGRPPHVVIGKLKNLKKALKS